METVKTTKRIILDLAKEYLSDENYHEGFILKEWIDRVTAELKLEELDDLALANMWDMVYLTLDSECYYCHLNHDKENWNKYRDVQSAFAEVVNVEARKRKGEYL